MQPEGARKRDFLQECSRREGIGSAGFQGGIDPLALALRSAGAMRFAEIRYSLIVRRGGDPTKGDKLSAMQQHLLELALKALVRSRDIVVIDGHGEADDPDRYVTVECFASMTGEQIRNTAHAKRIIAKLQGVVANETAAKVKARGGIYSRHGGSG